MHQIAPHHTPLLVSSRPPNQGRSSSTSIARIRATNHPSAPCLAHHSKRPHLEPHFFSLQLPQHQHHFSLHLDFPSLPALGIKSPISRPRPQTGATLARWIRWTLAHCLGPLPQTAQRSFLLLRLHQTESCCVPLFPFPLRLSVASACQALLLTRTRTSNTDTLAGIVGAHREKRSQSLCAHRRRRDRCLDIYSETHFPSMQQSVISYPNLCALSSAPRRFAQANTAAAQAMPHQIHSCRSYLPLRHPNPSRHSSSHQHVHIG